MIEQIILYILIFISGIIFAHRNAYLKVLEQMLYKMAEDAKIQLKDNATNFYLRFDNLYYMIYAHLGKKEYSQIRNRLEEMKSLVKEFLGE